MVARSLLCRMATAASTPAIRQWLPQLPVTGRISITTQYPLLVKVHDGIDVPFATASMAEALVDIYVATPNPATALARLPSAFVCMTSEGDQVSVRVGEKQPYLAHVSRVILHMPADYGIKAQQGVASNPETPILFHLENLYGDTEVTVGSASLRLEKLNCSNLKASTQTGDITGSSLTGPVELTASKGSIRCRKIQTNEALLSAVAGRVSTSTHLNTPTRLIIFLKMPAPFSG